MKTKYIAGIDPCTKEKPQGSITLAKYKEDDGIVEIMFTRYFDKNEDYDKELKRIKEHYNVKLWKEVNE